MNISKSLIVTATLFGLTSIIANANTLTSEAAIQATNVQAEAFTLGAKPSQTKRFNKIVVQSSQSNQVQNTAFNLGAKSSQTKRFNKITVSDNVIATKKSGNFGLGFKSETTVRFNKLKVSGQQLSHVNVETKTSNKVVSKGFSLGASS